MLLLFSVSAHLLLLVFVGLEVQNCERAGRTYCSDCTSASQCLTYSSYHKRTGKKNFIPRFCWQNVCVECVKCHHVGFRQSCFAYQLSLQKMFSLVCHHGKPYQTNIVSYIRGDEFYQMLWWMKKPVLFSPCSLECNNISIVVNQR